MENIKSELSEAKAVIDKQENELRDMTNKLSAANETIIEIGEKYEECQLCVQQQTEEVSDILSEFNVADLTLKGAKDLVHMLHKGIERDKQNVTDLETELASLKQDMVLTETSYKEKVLDLTQEINTKQEEIRKISDESEDLKRKLDSAVLETNQLKRETDIVRESQSLKGDELESKIQILLSQISDSEKLLSEKNTTIREQSKQIETIKCDIQKTIEENDSYKSELFLLRNACDEKDKTLTDLNHSYSRVEEMFKQLETECHNLSTEVGERDTKIQDLVTNVKVLECNLRDEEHRLLDLNTQKDIIESENHVMKEEIAQKDSLTANLLHKLNEETQRRLSEEEQITYLKTSNEETLQCLKSLELEAEHVKCDLETTHLELNRIKNLCSEKDNTVHELAQTVETITNENQRLEVCSSEALEKLTLTEASLKEVAEKLKASEEALLAVQAENEILQTQVSGMQLECNQKHEQLCSLQASLSQVQSENDFLKLEMQTLERTALDCSSDVVSLLKHVCCLNSEVQQKLSLVLSQHEDMSQNFDSASSSISELSLKSDKADVENLQHLSEAMENEHEASICRNYLICITKHLNSAKTEIETLNTNSMKIFSTISDMSHSAKDLETVLASLQSKNTDLRASVQQFECLLTEKLSEIEVLQSSQSELQMIIKKLKERLHEIESTEALTRVEIVKVSKTLSESETKELDDSSQYFHCDKQDSASDNGNILLENQVLKCQICDLNDNLKLFDEKCQTLETEVQIVKENWKKLKTSLGSIENSYQTAQKDKEALQAKFDFTKEKMDLMHDERDRYKSEVQRLSEELKKLYSQQAVGGSSSEEVALDTQTPTHSVNEEENLYPELKRLQKDNIDLQIKVESGEKALQEKENTCKNLQLLNEKCLAELSDFKVKIESVTSRYDELEILYSALLEEKQTADDEIKKRFEKSESLTKVVSELQHEIESLKSKAEIAEADREKQDSECKSKASQLEGFTHEKQRLQEIINTTQDSIRLSHSVVHQQLLEVETKYKDKEDTLKMLSEDFETLRKEYNELKEEHKHYVCQNKIMTEDNQDLKTQMCSVNEAMQKTIVQEKALKNKHAELVAEIDFKTKELFQKESEMSDLQRTLEVSESKLGDLSNSLKTQEEILQEKKLLISHLADILHLQNVDEQDYLPQVEIIMHQRANFEIELSENNAKLKSTELEIEEKEKRCKELLSVNEKYVAHLNDLRTEVEFTKDKKDELEKKYSSLISEKEIANNELKKTLEENKCFTSTVSDLQTEITLWESKVLQLNKDVASLKMTIEMLQSDKEKLIDGNNASVLKLKETEGENRRLMTTINKLQESLTISHSTVESKQKELLEMESKCKNLESSVSLKNDESESVRKECIKLKEDNKWLIDQKEILAQEIEELNFQMCSLKESLQKAAFSQKGLETTNAMLIVEKKNMAKASEEKGLEIFNLEAEVTKKNAKLKSAQLEIEEREKVNNDLQSVNEKYLADLNDLRMDVEVTKDRNEELEKKYSSLISEKEIADSDLKKTFEENKCFINTISDLQKGIKSLETKIIELNNDIASSKLTIEKLLSEKEKQIDESNSILLKLEETEEKNKRLMEKINKLQESLTTSHSAVELKQKELLEMESKCKNLESSVSIKNDESESVRKECIKLKEDNKCSIDQKEILAQEIEELNLQMCSLKESLQKAALGQKGLETTSAMLIVEKENMVKALEEKGLEIFNLEAEISKKNAELKSAQLEIEEREKINNDLQSVNEKYLADLNYLRMEVHLTKDRNEELEKKYFSLISEKEIADNDLKKTFEENKCFTNTISDLQKEIKSLESKIIELNNDIASSKLTIEKLLSEKEMQIDESNANLLKLEETEEKKKRLMEKINKLQESLTTSHSALELKQKELFEIESKCKSLENTVSVKVDESESLRKECLKLKEDNKCSIYQKEILAQEIVDFNFQMCSLKESLQKAAFSQKGLETSTAMLTVENENLTKALVKKDLEISNLESELQVNKNRVEEAICSIKSFELAQEEKNAMFSQISTTLQLPNADQRNLVSQINQLVDQKVKLEAELIRSETNCQGFLADKSKMEEIINELKATNSANDIELREANVRFREVDDTRQKLVEDVDDLTGELAEYKNRLLTAENVISDCENKISTFTSEINEFKENNEVLSSRLEASESQVKIMSSTLSENEIILSKIKADLENKEKMCQELSSQLSIMSENVSAKDSENTELDGKIRQLQGEILNLSETLGDRNELVSLKESLLEAMSEDLNEKKEAYEKELLAKIAVSEEVNKLKEVIEQSLATINEKKEQLICLEQKYSDLQETHVFEKQKMENLQSRLTKIREQFLQLLMQIYECNRESSESNSAPASPFENLNNSNPESEQNDEDWVGELVKEIETMQLNLQNLTQSYNRKEEDSRLLQDKIKEYDNQQELSEVQITEMQQLVNEKETEIANLANNVQELETNLKKIKEERDLKVELLSDNVEDLVKQLDSCTQQRDDIESELTDVMSNLENTESTRLNLEHELKSNEICLEEKSAALEVLQDQFSGLSDENSKLVKTLHERESILLSKDSQIEQLTLEKQDLLLDCSNLEKVEKELTASVQILQEKVELFEAELSTKQLENELKCEELSKSDEQLKNSQSRLDDMSTEISYLESSVEKYKEEIISLESSLTDLNDNITHMKSINKELHSQLTNKDTQFQILYEEHKELMHDHTSENSACSRLGFENQALKRNVERYEERLDEASTKEAELKSFVDAYSIQIEEMDNNKSEMSKNIEQMKEDIENLNQLLKDEKEAHQESKMVMEKLTEDSKERNENIMIQISVLQNSYQDIITKFCSMESECCCQILKTEKLKQTKDVFEHEKDSLSSQNESLEKQLFEQFQWVSELRKESDKKDKIIEAHERIEHEAAELKETVLDLKEDQKVKLGLIESLENELKATKKKLEDAEVKSLALVVGLEADKDTLMAEIDDMSRQHSSEINILKDALQNLEESMSTGQVTESTLNENLASSLLKVKHLEDENEALKCNMNVKLEEFETLQSEVCDLQTANESLLSNISECTEDSKNKKSEITNIELLKTELEDKLEIMKQDHDKALNDLSSSMTEVERLSSQVKEGDLRNKELFQTSVELSEKIEDRDSEVERLVHCLNTANSELRECQRCICKKDEEIHILENSVSSLREECLSDKSVLSRLMMDMNGANQKFSVLIDTIIEKDKAMSDIENQLSEVGLLLEEANRDKSKFAEEANLKNDEVSNLLTEKEEMETLLKEKTFELEKFATELEALQMSWNSTSENFGTCQEEKSGVEKELSVLQEKFAKRNGELDYLKTQINELENVLGVANIQNTSYKDSLQEDDAHIEYLLESAKCLKNSLEKQQIEIDSLQKNHKDVQETVSKYEDLITEKTSQTCVLIEELESAESRLQSQISVNSKLLVQKQNLDKMLGDAQSKEANYVILKEKEEESTESLAAENTKILSSLELSEQPVTNKQNLIDQLILEKSALVTRLRHCNENDFKSFKENSRLLKDDILNLKHDFLNYQESLTDQILSAMSTCTVSINNDICSLQTQIKDQSDLITDNKATIQSLEKQRDEILEQLNVRQADYDTILPQYQSLEESNQNLRVENENYELEMGKIREALAQESQLVRTLVQTVQDTKYQLNEVLAAKEIIELKNVNLADENLHIADENERLNNLLKGYTSKENKEISLNTQSAEDHLQSINDNVDENHAQEPQEPDLSTVETLNHMIVVQSQQILALEQELANLKETQMPTIEWDDYDLRDICNKLEKEKQDLTAEVSNQNKLMKKKDVQIKTLSRQLETLNKEIQDKHDNEDTQEVQLVSESERLDVEPIGQTETMENKLSEVESVIIPDTVSSLTSMDAKEVEPLGEVPLEETDLNILKEKLHKLTQERDKFKADNKKLLKVGKGKDTKLNLMNKNFEKLRQERDTLLADRDSLENELQDVNSKNSNFDSTYDKEVINNLMMRCKQLEALCEEKQLETLRPDVLNVSQSGDSSQDVVLDKITVSTSNKLEQGQDTLLVDTLSKSDSKLKGEVIKLQKINKGKEAKIRKLEEKLTVQENETKNLKEILSQKDEDLSVSVEDRATFEKLKEQKIILEFELQCAKEELTKFKLSQSLNIGEATDKDSELVPSLATEKEDPSEQLDISEFSEDIVRSKVIGVLQENKRLKQENNKLLKLSKGKEAKVKKAEDLISQQQKIISDKDTDILILKESVKDLTSKIEALDEDEHDLRYRLENALIDRDEWYDHCQDIEDQLDAAHESIDMKNDELLRLDEAADADRETIDNLMYERDSIEREVESLKNELEILQNTLNKKDGEIKDLEAKLEETIEQKEKLALDVKKLNMVKKGKDAKAKKLEESMLVQGSAIEASEEYITGLEDKIKEKQAHVHALKQENESLKSQMQSLESYKDDLENEMGMLNTKLNDQNQQIKHLHEINETHYENFESQTAKMVEEMQHQETSQNELKEQLHITLVQKNELQKRLVESEQTIQQMNMFLAEKEETISDLEKRLYDSSQETNDKLVALSTEQESMKDIMSQIEEKDRYVANLLEKIGIHEKAAEQSMWEIHTLQEQLSNLLSVNMELEQIIQAKTEALDSATAKCDALKTQFDSNISLLQEKDNEVSALRKKYLALDQESVMKQSLIEEKEKHWTNISEEKILKLQKLIEEKDICLNSLTTENHNLHLEKENLSQTIEKVSKDSDLSKQQWLSEKYALEQNLNWYIQYHETSDAENRALQEEKEGYEAKLQEMSARLTEITEGLKNSEESVQKMINEKEEYEAKFQEMDTKLTENSETLKTREKSVEKMMSEKDEMINELQTKNSQLLEKLNIYESDFSERKVYEASLMKEIESLRIQYQDTEAKLKDAEEVSQKTSFEKEQLVVQYNLLLEKATVLENEWSQKETSKHELVEEIDSLKYQNQDINSRLNECAEELKKALDLVQNVNTEKDELQARLNQSLENCRISHNSEDSLQKVLIEKEQLLNEWYGKYNQELEKVDTYEKDLNAAKNHVDYLIKETENMRSQYQELLDKLKEVEISSQRYAGENEGLRIKYSQALEKVSLYENDVNERNTMEDKLREEIHSLKTENQNMCTKIEEYSTKLMTAEDMLQNTHFEREKLQTTIKMCENDLSERSSIADTLREENDNLRYQNQLMKNQIEEYSIKLRETEETIQNTCVEKENLQTRLRESLEKNEMFEDTLKENSCHEDNLLKEIESLKNQCQDINLKMADYLQNLKNCNESYDMIVKEKDELQSKYNDTLAKLGLYENELSDKTIYQEKLLTDMENVRHQFCEINTKLVETSEKLQKAEESKMMLVKENEKVVDEIQVQYSQAVEKQAMLENEFKLKSEHANELLTELDTLRTQYQQLAMQREQEISEKDQLIASLESELKEKSEIHSQSARSTESNMQDLYNVPVHEEMVQTPAVGTESSSMLVASNEHAKVSDKDDNVGNQMSMEVKKLKKLCKGKDAKIKKLEEKIKAVSEAGLPEKVADDNEGEAKLLKYHLQQVETSLNEVLNEKEKLLLEIENLTGQVSSMQTHIDTLLSDQKQASELEESLKNQIAQLQTYSESVANDLEAYKVANDQWQSYLSKVETDHNDNMQQSQAVVDNLKAQLNECSSQISTLSQSNEEYNVKLQSVLKEKEECLSLASLKDDELKNLKDIMKKQMTEIQDMNKKLELSDQTDKGLQSEKERFEELLKTEREEIQSLYEQMNELVSEKLDLESVVQAKEQDLKAAKETLEVLANDREKLEKLQSEKEELQLEVVTLSRDINTLRERFGEKDSEKEELVNNLNQKETALENMREQLHEYESEKEMLVEKLKNTSDELLLTQDKAEALSQELETKKEAATKLKDMCFEKDQLVESLKETINTINDENQSLKQQKDQACDELVLYKQQYHEENKKNHNIEAKFNKLTEKCKHLEESVTEKTNTLISKAEEIGALHRQIASLELQGSQVKEEMVKLQTVSVHGAVDSAVGDQGQGYSLPDMSNIESQIVTKEAVPVAAQAPTDTGYLSQVYYIVSMLKCNQSVHLYNLVLVTI